MQQSYCSDRAQRVSSPPPPPYFDQEPGYGPANSAAINNSPMLDEMIEQLIIRSNPPVRPSIQAEASRLRKFLVLTLIEDYECKHAPPIGLTASDMEHFTTLTSILGMANGENAVGDSSERGEALGPYIQQCFFEPCRALGIRFEAVWLALKRFFSFTSLHGLNLPDKQMQALFEKGTEVLASKLYVDRTIMIPRLVESPQLMREMFDGLERVTARYFEGPVELEISNLPTESCCMLNWSYKLSPFGLRQRELIEEAKRTDYKDMSPSHWLARFKHFFGKKQEGPKAPA